MGEAINEIIDVLDDMSIDQGNEITDCLADKIWDTIFKVFDKSDNE